MYPPSPYAVPVGSFRNPQVPPTAPPRTGPFVYIPLNCQWIPLIAGSLKQLLLESTWQVSSVEELQNVQGQVFDLISLFNCATAKGFSQFGQFFGAGDLEDTLIRQNPDNPCLIESSADGIHWCPLADISLCISGPQPGVGAEQPVNGGGEACFTGTLQANQIWLLPVPVSTGDVIDLQEANGAGVDGNALLWECADGRTFFAGQCIGAPNPAVSGDPLMSAAHMRLIWNIGGTFYDAMAGPLTIPSGVSNVQPSLQVNSDPVNVNSGAYGIKVCVTNNQSIAYDVSITYLEWGTSSPLLATGPSGVNFGQIFTITSITSARAIFAIFDRNVKMEILSSSNYVEFPSSPSNFDYMWVDTGGTRHNIATNAAGDFPTAWNPATSVQAFGAVSDVGSAWSVTVRLSPG